MKFIRMFLFLILIIGSQSSWTQIDLSTSVLLQNNGNNEIENEKFESKRYESRSTDKNTVKRAEKNKIKKKILADSKKSKIIEIQKDDQGVTTPSGDESKAKKAELSNNSFSNLQKLILGLSDESLSAKSKDLPADDLRKNIIELELAPTYIYNSSSSISWLRSYFKSGPALQLAMKVWLSPYLSLNGKILTTYSTELPADTTGDSLLQTSHEISDFGITVRKFFKKTSMSPYMTYGFHYTDNTLKLPSDTDLRLQLRSSGLKISFQGYFPSSKTFTWISGASFSPKLNHTEISTKTVARSGNQPESYKMGLWIGGQYFFDRKNQVFWKLSHSVEKNQFESTTTVADPVSNKIYEGVTVTNSLSFLQFGFIWGN